MSKELEVVNGLTLKEIEEVKKYLLEHKQMKADIKTLKETESRTRRDVRDIKEEYPLLPPEADDLSNAVRRKGVQILGGKKSAAYKNVALRKRLYRDIYGEIKRQYGLEDERGRQQSYKKLKRKYLNGAFSIVSDYSAPIAIANDIDAENELGDED